MKRILVLTASPRKNGNSAVLADAFCDAVKNRGFEVTQFDTAFMKIRGCFACNCCFKTGKPCAFDDDFNKIATEIDVCDALVFVSPVYWYSFPSQIKAVIDRFYCFDMINKKFSGKKSALISCCEDTGEDVFKGITYLYRETDGRLKFESVGEVLVCGAAAKGDIRNTDGEKKAALLALKF
jgi:multimeric flavodoxin WrbA